LVRHLSSKCEALNSNSSTTKKKKKKEKEEESFNLDMSSMSRILTKKDSKIK
jgi:hypothetical protein